MSDPRRTLPISPAVATNARSLQTFALQTWVDDQDGSGPQLRTVLLQAVAVYPVDPGGNVLERDDVVLDAAFRRALLDELRAVRIGVEMLLEDRPRPAGQSLLEMAQETREDPDDLGYAGEGASPNQPGAGGQQ